MNATTANAPSRAISKSLRQTQLGIAAGALAISLCATINAQNDYVQHNLVSDIPGLADFTDTNLVNPWGIAFSGTSPFWISDNHAGVSTLYNSSGTPQTLVVAVPTAAGGTPPGSPTGIIFNGTTGFTIASNTPARFIFATEDGTISGWASGGTAVLKVDNSAAGAIYKGLAIGNSGGSNFLYATDFHNGKVDVFNTNYLPTTLAGSFSDPTIPADFAPFGIQNLSGQLYVTYAKQDANKEDDVGGAGNGYINVFDTSGNLVRRLVSNGVLNSPWGLAMAPDAFGEFSHKLLVGNFGNGHINAFDPATGDYLGTMNDSSNGPIAIQGLWGIAFGNGGNGGDKRTLYFAAGIAGTNNIENHGLFGSLSALMPTFTTATNRGLGTTLAWSGGVGPFLVQQKNSLTSSNWLNVLTTTNHNLLLPRDGTAGFYRIQNQATNTVVAFTALLNNAGENPPNSASNAIGIALLTLESSNLTWHITFSGLSAPATAAHIHSPAAPTNNAGVQIPFSGVPAATAGTIFGSAVLTAAQASDIINGLAYVNIHDTNFPGGEIRGQIVPLRIPLTMNGASEVPPVATAGTANGTLTMFGSQLYYDISYSGLSSSATAAHIHGPADTTNGAGVIIPLNNPSGTSGTISGSVTVNSTNLAYLLAGKTYINIHTLTNGGGEIRGQILPLQFSAALSGAFEPSPTASAGTGSGTFSVLNNVLTYSVTYTNLLSAATASHIHGPASVTGSAGVIIPLSGTPAARSGTISGSASITPQQLLWMVNGLTYANIHTTNFPGGEIRGQVYPKN